MTTTLEKWAFIDQKDTEEGKVTPYLGVEKGKNFSGRMLYFAIDEAGNKTDVFEKVINIQNENTAYDITPKNVEKPTSSYDITITTNENNTVYYRWKKAEDNSVITGIVNICTVIKYTKFPISYF